MKSVIFICGALRSGSSLTHLMLDSHPQIKNPGEFDFLFDQITNEGQFPEITKYHDWLSTHRIFLSKSLIIDKRLSFGELIESFIEQLSETGKLLALNVHRSFDRIHYLFPDAKYIHLLRDPRDVSRSSIGMGWAGNVFYGVDHWIETEMSWKKLTNEKLLSDSFELRYEDLISFPEVTLRKICDFLGMPYSVEMLAYTKASTYSEPNPKLVFQWKTKLTIREVQYVEAKTSNLMIELGYPLSGNKRLTLGIFERVWLKVTDKVFKAIFSIKRYGIILFFKERISRLLKLKDMNKKACIAINEIDKLFLK